MTFLQSEIALSSSMVVTVVKIIAEYGGDYISTVSISFPLTILTPLATARQQ